MPNTSGSIAGTSVADNQPPSVVGSTFRAHRTSTTTVGTVNGVTASGFFDTLDYISPDLVWDGLHLTVSIQGTYAVSVRYNCSNIPGGAKATATAHLNGTLVRWISGGFSDSSLGANAPSGIGGTALIYCNAGDVLAPGYQFSSNGTVTGEATGATSYFEVALVNRSLA